VLYNGWQPPPQLSGCYTDYFNALEATPLSAFPGSSAYPYIAGDSAACKAWKLAATVGTSEPVLMTSASDPTALNFYVPSAGGFTAGGGMGQFCQMPDAVPFIACAACTHSSNALLGCHAGCGGGLSFYGNVTGRDCSGVEVPLGGGALPAPPPRSPTLVPASPRASGSLLGLLALLALIPAYAWWRGRAPPMPRQGVWKNAWEPNGPADAEQARLADFTRQYLAAREKEPEGLLAAVAASVLKSPPQPAEKALSPVAGQTRRSELQNMVTGLSAATGRELGSDFMNIPV